MESIGVDIEQIERFNLNQHEHDIFFRHVYTEEEIDFCMQKQKPQQHLAGRFAAKEATIKALSQIGISGIAYHEIEIRSNPYPVITIKKQLPIKISAHLSISHGGEYAIAATVVKYG